MGVLGTPEMFVLVACAPSVISRHFRQVPRLAAVMVSAQDAQDPGLCGLAAVDSAGHTPGVPYIGAVD